MISIHKIVIFGAGRIGRAFIGQLFSLGGYEVVFVDVLKSIIDELNRRRQYNVVIKSEKEEVLRIEHVRGIHFENKSAVAKEISDASILAISTGPRGIDSAISLIAAGLLERFDRQPDRPLDIIIAENMRNGSEYIKERLSHDLPDWYPLESLIGLVESSIGKMVPIMTGDDLEKDILQVYAEPYNTLILDRAAFMNPVPQIEGLAPKENIKAWIDRKLFIHNLGHVTAAYSGYFYYPGDTYIYEVLEHEIIRHITRDTMRQSAFILKVLYPGTFTDESLEEHIDDLIHRFRNKALKDTVYRVGSDIKRKLGREDRLLAPYLAGSKLNLPVDLITKVIYYGTNFKARDENGKLHPDDKDFFDRINTRGSGRTIIETCGLSQMEYETLSASFRTLEKGNRSNE